MAYQLFDNKGQEINHHFLQDKKFWCKDGEKIEEAFVRNFGAELGYEINPEKKTNPFAPDLVNTKNKGLADLKFQGTPFFKANSLFNIDPKYAVVFNQKDQIRYLREYPNIEIVYWVDWKAVRFLMGQTDIKVGELRAIYQTDFKVFNTALTTSHLHFYQQRVDDERGNAKGSYVIDIRNPCFSLIKEIF